MRSRMFLPLLIVVAVTVIDAQSTAPTKPARINRAIEMLEKGQPIYYTQTSGSGYEPF